CCGLLGLCLTAFPGASFLFLGAPGSGTQEVAPSAPRHRARLALVSKLHPDANLFEPPPPYRGHGRPRQKGARLPKPRQQAQSPRRRHTVGWYGGGRRRGGLVGGTGDWYKSGRGVVPIRWVSVRDLDGTHRDEFFYTTDTKLTAAEVVSHYTARWNMETTFQELRSHLGLESTRGWCRRTVLRAAPCLFGLYTVVAL